MLSIHLTDLQIHTYKKFDKGGSRLANCLRVIEDVYTFAAKNNIKLITFAGDMYDSQKVLPIKVVNKTIATFVRLVKQYPDIVWVAITGNHDQDEKNLLASKADTAMEHLNTIFPNNFILIDDANISLEPLGVRTIVHGIPYYEYAEHYAVRLAERSAEAEKFKAAGFKNLLMVHQTPNGSGNPNIKIDTDVNDPLYAPFDFVWCGHIHGKQEITPKFYLGGSPIHRDLGDEGIDKGFWIQDMEVLTDPHFYSLRGRYPEYKRVKGETVPEKFADDFVVLEPIIDDLPVAEAAQIEEFSTNLTSAALMENYWKAVDGKDKGLLEVGLEFVK